MAERSEEKPVRIVNEQGKTVMSMNSVGREGDRLAINGVMMGAWPADMYVGPEDFLSMLKMVLRKPAVIGYVFQLPFILRRTRAETRRKAQATQAN